MTDSDLPRPPRSWASSRRDPTVFYRQDRSSEVPPHPNLPSPHIRSRPRRRRTVRVARLRSEYVRNSQLGHPRVPRRNRHRHREPPRLQSESSSRARSRHPADGGDPSARGRYRPLREDSLFHSRRRPSLVDAARNLATSWIEEKSRLDDDQMTRPVSMVAVRPPFPPSGGEGDRTRRVYGRAPKPTAPTTQVVPLQKPIASSGGITCSILLAEPNVYLSGFDHDSRARRNNQPSGTALLRGKLQLVVSKNVKIKALQLKLVGRTRTEWPEGIPPIRMQEWEEDSLRTQVLTFFNATYGTWETEYGNQCSFSLTKSDDPTELSLRPFSVGLDSPPLDGASVRRSKTTSKELKRLGLRSVRARSFGQGEASDENVTPSRKGYKIFKPGTYEYSFELPIDHHQLETTRLPFGSVKWELQATVERAGAFRPNLHGSKELSIVRLPDQLSLETTEPISISRQWDDQLHYDIVVSGKSFPIGSKIPVAFKFTPLAKVQVYKIRVFVAESIEYFTNDRQVHRREPGRKLLLMEKTAGKPMDPSFGADLRTTSGGELSAQELRSAREASRRRRGSASGSEREREREPISNLLGDLGVGAESFWGPTEIEADVQIPTCEMMRRNKDASLHADSSWKNVTVDHWVKIVMRVSRPDPDDLTGRKRRHFEISIDSPITLLDCRATQANTSLPEYSGLDRPRHHVQRVCGCPDAATLSSRDESTLSTIQRGFLPTGPPPAAPAARRPRPFSAVEPMGYERPIHLIRRPSFNPPAFDEEDPPPPAEEPDTTSILTPPPRYDSIVGTPSVDGYADYFARYSASHGAGTQAAIEESDDVAVEDEEEVVQDEDEEEEEESDSDGDTTLGRVGVVNGRKRLTERTGRVNVVNPRTPGGVRVPSRSLEISRPFVLSEAPVGRR